MITPVVAYVFAKPFCTLRSDARVNALGLAGGVQRDFVVVKVRRERSPAVRRQRVVLLKEGVFAYFSGLNDEASTIHGLDDVRDVGFKFLVAGT